MTENREFLKEGSELSFYGHKWITIIRLSWLSQCLVTHGHHLAVTIYLHVAPSSGRHTTVDSSATAMPAFCQLNSTVSGPPVAWHLPIRPSVQKVFLSLVYSLV